MKVVHINTHDTGGAAIAAYNLHKSLKQTGVESAFMVLYNSNKFPDAITFKPKWYHFLRKKLFFRFRTTFLSEQLDKKIELFSSPDTFYDILSSSVVQSADIIHLHWVANFVDYKTFFNRCSKKIVWTFHDLNPIQGGFHYNLDKAYASDYLLKIDKLYLDLKLKYLKKATKIKVICPSYWLKYEIEKSFFKKVFDQIEIIHYGVDAGFNIENSAGCRNMLSLDLNKTLILVIATNLQNYRKGFDMALSVIEKMENEKNVEFILVGDLSQSVNLSNVRIIGEVKEISQLKMLFNSVNGVLISSREDNLPNVMLESLVCGTPVFGFAVGGVSEVVKSGVNGLLTDVVSPESLLEVTEDFLISKGELNRNKIASDASAQFGLSRQCSEVTKTYREVINDSVN